MIHKLGSKTLALVAVVFLLMGSIAGCGKSGDTPDNEKTQSGTASSEGSQATVTNAAADGLDSTTVSGSTQEGQKTTTTTSSVSTNLTVTKGNTFPIIQNGKLTLSIMVPRQNGAPTDFETLPFTKEYEKKTGIDIKYIVVNEGEQNTKSKIALASGNLPDIFALYGGSLSSTDMYQYAKEGAFVAIDSYLPDYGQNILKTFEDVPAAKAVSVMSDGHIYGLPSVKAEGYTHNWTINKKWLDELGLSIPKTIDEFYTVLKAFKTQDPNGNGKKDEEAFAMWEWNPNIWNPWGLNLTWSTPNKMTVDEKGKVFFAPLTDQFREGIRFWNKCYNEGLIYKRALGTTYAEFTAILAEGKVGCFIWPWPESVFKENQWDDYVTFATPKGSNTANFKAGVSPYTEGIYANCFVITKNCPNVAAAVRFLDYFYTVEGNFLKTYGPAGEHYIKVGNKYKLISSSKSYLLSGLGDQVVGGNCRVPDSLIYKKHKSEMSALEKYVAKRDEYIKTIFEPNNPKYTVSTIMLSKEEADKVKEYEVCEGAYLWGLQALIGSKNVETEWNAMVTQYKNLGADKLAQVYQAAFNRQHS